MILKTEGLTKQFGKLVALADVSFAVEEGRVFGIAGPNGAGKSTLFNVIAGGYRASAGHVLFSGHDITKLSPHTICRLGLARTFQIPVTFKTLSVYDNVRVGATFGGHDPHGRRQRIENTLDFLGLNSCRDTVASNLDLYTTKLVMLGAALATGCKLLMLDEPLAGLSSIEISNFLSVVRNVNHKQGITLLIIEHLLDSLIEISSEILILHNGHAIYTGSPHGVREDARVIEVYLGEGEGDDEQR